MTTVFVQNNDPSERNGLIDAILDHPRNPFTEAALAQMPTEELRKMAKLASGSSDDDQDGAFGWGSGPTDNEADDGPFLAMPDDQAFAANQRAADQASRDTGRGSCGCNPTVNDGELYLPLPE